MSADICIDGSALNMVGSICSVGANDPPVGDTVFVFLLTFTNAHPRHAHTRIKQLTNKITIPTGNVVGVPIV
jgi:hypothetical protein